MTKMQKIEDAARLAMAGFPELDAPQLLPKSAPRRRFPWPGAALAVAGAIALLWLIV